MLASNRVECCPEHFQMQAATGNSVEADDSKKAWGEIQSLGEEIISYLKANYE
jgi:hypothetical protein